MTQITGGASLPPSNAVYLSGRGLVVISNRKEEGEEEKKTLDYSFLSPSLSPSFRVSSHIYNALFAFPFSPTLLKTSYVRIHTHYFLLLACRNAPQPPSHEINSLRLSRHLRRGNFFTRPEFSLIISPPKKGRGGGGGANLIAILRRLLLPSNNRRRLSDASSSPSSLAWRLSRGGRKERERKKGWRIKKKFDRMSQPPSFPFSTQGHRRRTFLQALLQGVFFRLLLFRGAVEFFSRETGYTHTRLH